MFKRNVSFSKRVMVSNWRKSAFATWSAPGDPQAYCMQTIDVEAAERYISKSSEYIRLTHIIGAQCAKMIEEFPEINRIIRFGEFFQRSEIAIFFQVAVDTEGKDLSGYTVRNINEKTIEQIALEMKQKVSRIKTGDDFQYKKVKRTMGFFPNFLTPFVVKVYGHILYTLNIWSSAFGSPKDTFGSMMITNIGSLGLQTAFAPLVPYSRVPLLLSVGKSYEKPVAKDGEIVIQKSIDCCWTLDHRLIDGVQGAKMTKRFNELMQNL